MNIRQILFPIDLSQSSNSATRYVHAMADLFGAKAIVMHAVDDPLKWYGSPHSTEIVESEVPKALGEAEQSLRRFAEAEFPNLDVAIVSELANPAELIEKTANDTQVELIMIPTHEQGPFAALLGSVTARVLHDLAAPVWTKSFSGDAGSDGHLPVKTVACAIDLGSASASNIEPPMYMEDFARAEIQKLQDQAGTSAEVWIEGDPIDAVVRKAAVRREADLIIMGRGEISHFAGPLSGHAYSIIQEAPCPVLSL